MVAAARASRRSRWRSSGCIATADGSALSATVRPRRSILGAIDDAHAAASDLFDHFVRSDDRAGKQRLEIGGVNVRGLLEKRRRRSRASAAAPPPRGAASHRRRSAGRSRRGARRRLFERSLKDVLQPLPLLAASRRPAPRVVGRRRSPSSARFSHARASAHCRLTVAGDEPITSATSSTVRPPK